MCLLKGILQHYIRRDIHSPSIYKINKLFGELHVLVGGREARWVSVHHLEQLLKHRVPLWVRETTGGHLHHSDAQRPHVTAHVIALVTLWVDPLRCHVWSTARVLSLGDRVNQLTRDAEITQLDVTTGM